MPIVAITPDLALADGRPRLQCARAYAACVASAGGTPVVLHPDPALIGEYLRLCHAFVLTGGDDPIMEPLGGVTHPSARTLHPDRQRFELALLGALHHEHHPVLGICLGMQLMVLDAGGGLHQHLPDVLETAGDHLSRDHPVVPESPLLRSGMVQSHHHQGVGDAGSLRVASRAHDGLIEAVVDPTRPFYVGVQWHPERTEDPALGSDLFEALVRAVG